MDIIKFAEKYTSNLNPKLANKIFKFANKFSYVNKMVEAEYGKIMEELRKDLKPYKDTTETFVALPREGIEKSKIIGLMTRISDQEKEKWENGFASGAVYNENNEHIEFLNQIYALNSQTNPLHSDLWPSANKYESEIVSMTAKMLGADKTADEICGVVSSGGTESILLAMKAYRDFAKSEKGISRPEMIICTTAHAAFEKAAQYFNIKAVKVPFNKDYKADVSAVKKAITRNTIVIVGSAPAFPHGIIDPIEELSELAFKHNTGFHTDACLGGFVLPWAKKLGYKIPDFDFSLRGVTSVSVDTHKYGYAAKGTSVILYRGPKLRHYQYFTTTDWPGGLYFSPTFAGSRPGALSAACWASLVTTGEKGYLEATEKILETAKTIKAGIQKIKHLEIIGDPFWVIAFKSDTIDIYRVMEQMTKMGWSLNGLHKPPCVHICITLRHTKAGVSERFLDDLEKGVEYVIKNPQDKGTMAPVYGMASNLPVKNLIGELLQRYMDILYKP